MNQSNVSTNVSAKMPKASVSVKSFAKPASNPNLVNQTKIFNSVAVARKQVNRARTKQFKK
jgi:hypothetical protein